VTSFLRKATEPDPDSTEARDFLAVAMFRLGDRDGARKQYEILERLDPNLDGKIKKLLSEETSGNK
jgi:Flp pilus assembly protein TadD